MLYVLGVVGIICVACRILCGEFKSMLGDVLYVLRVCDEYLICDIYIFIINYKLYIIYYI